MARALLSFVVILTIALGAVWIADRPGQVTIEWLGLRIELTIALALTLTAILIGAIYISLRIVLWTLGSVSAFGSFLTGRKERRARTALTRGLVALATGDVRTALRVIRDAERLEDERPLLLLLRAQTAERTGDEAHAEEAYRAMLDHSTTELLGLLGLVRLMRGRGESETALGLADRAFKLQPSNPQAFEAAFALNLTREHWAEARRIVESAGRAKLLSRSAVNRRLAASHLAEAQQLRGDEKSQAALSAANKALSLVPDFSAAAVLAADIHKNFGKRGKAAHVIEAVWKAEPHPELGRLYAQIPSRETAEERFRRIQGLVELNRDHLESRVLFARYAIAAKRFAAARDALRPLLEPQPTARVAELMAKIEEVENEDHKAAEEWLARAAHAPRDALWLCRDCGRQAAHWSPVCPQCSGFDTQYWKAAGDHALLADEAEEDDASVFLSEEDEGPVAKPGLLGRLMGEKAPAVASDAKPTPVLPAPSAPVPANDPVVEASPPAKDAEDAFAMGRQPDDPGPMEDQKRGKRSSKRQ